MTTEFTSADDATRRDGSRLSEGLALWFRNKTLGTPPANEGGNGD